MATAGIQTAADSLTACSVVDWDSKTVIGSKARATTKSASEKEVNAARRTGAAVETDRKSGVGNRSHADPNHQRIAAVDRCVGCSKDRMIHGLISSISLNSKDDVAPPATVSPDVGKAMQKARLDLGLTQKDLAGKTNEKVRFTPASLRVRAVLTKKWLVLSTYSRLLLE